MHGFNYTYQTYFPMIDVLLFLELLSLWLAVQAVSLQRTIF